MAKPSGLGRGLGDLLDDNNPSIRVQSATVVIRGTQQTEEPQKNYQKFVKKCIITSKGENNEPTSF